MPPPLPGMPAAGATAPQPIPSSVAGPPSMAPNAGLPPSLMTSAGKPVVTGSTPPGPPPMFAPPGQPQPGASNGMPGPPPVPGQPYARPGQPQQPPAPPAKDAPRSRLDPDHVPSPVAVKAADQAQYDKTQFRTNLVGELPPLATTDFVAVDEGIANPKFIRMTMYNLPHADDVARHAVVPMGAVIQPYASLSPNEAPVELVSINGGPLRCDRCKAYMNPFMQFVDGGRQFACNLCRHVSVVRPDYFCNLDGQGRRVDLPFRPELRHGSIDIVAPPVSHWGATPQEYSERPPQPAAYVFAIDVSFHSVSTGVLADTCRAIKESLDHFPRETDLAPSPVKVGFLTYDRNVHFYNLNPSLSTPQMLVVTDLEDMFVPLSTGFLVGLDESRELIEQLLTQLPTMFAGAASAESALGAATQAVLAALTGRGGRAFFFQACLPSSGPGALAPREDMKALGTDRERQFFLSQDDYYKKMAIEFAAQGICTEVFLPAKAYVDVATLGSLSTLTGGTCYHYGRYSPTRDNVGFRQDVAAAIRRPFVYDCVLRVRTSSGLRVVDHFGHFHTKNGTDLDIAGMDSDKAIAIALAHDGKIDEKHGAALQVAMLYTTLGGQRRIRLHNIVVPVTNALTNIFRLVDLDTVLNLMAKQAVHSVSNQTMQEVRDQILIKTTKMLYSYRKHCAAHIDAGQLILPEAMKLLPVYTLGVLKCAAFRGGVDVTFDERMDAFRFIKGAGVRATAVYFYPRMLAIHTLRLEAPEERPFEPSDLIRMSHDRLDPAGVYLMENGLFMILFIGMKASGTVLKALLDAPNFESIDPTLTELPELDTPFSKRVRQIVAHIQHTAAGGRVPRLYIIREREPAEFRLHAFWVEDKTHGQPAYLDHLIAVHRQIQAELAK